MKSNRLRLKAISLATCIRCAYICIHVHTHVHVESDIFESCNLCGQYMCVCAFVCVCVCMCVCVCDMRAPLCGGLITRLVEKPGNRHSWRVKTLLQTHTHKATPTTDSSPGGGAGTRNSLSVNLLTHSQKPSEFSSSSHNLR